MAEAFEIQSDAPYQGLDDKIELIRRYYRESLNHPSVRAAAEEFSHEPFVSPSLPALFTRLRSHFHYTPDPVGAELIKSPWVMLEEIERRGWFAGDCDDASSLAYALLNNMGVPAKLAVAWKGGENPEHILVIVPMEGDAELPFDLTAPQLGMTHEDVTRYEIYD